MKKKNILHEGKYLRFIKDDEWEYVERVHKKGVVIIVAMTQGKVVFVEQYRFPVKRKVIEFPAGLVNDTKSKKTETIFEAAKRELLEETGYQAGQIIKILAGPVSSGSSSDKVTMVMARGLKKLGEGGGDGTEFITVHEVPLTKVDRWLNKMLKKGCLIEPKIYAGLYFLKGYNKKIPLFLKREVKKQ